METHPRARSLFFPILLIGDGLIWLLANFNVIPDLNWAMLWRLWPLALIAAGLDLLFGRSHPLVGALVGLLTVGLAVALLVVGPRMGLMPAAPQLTTERFSEPLEGATAANITLDLAQYPTTVSALSGSDTLIDAELTHSGDVRFDATGGAQRQVRLAYSSGLTFFFPDFTGTEGTWNIGLSPAVPLDLNVDAGSGGAELDLSELALSGLVIDAGSGAVALTRPAAEAFYEVRIDGGSGAQTVEVPSGVAATLYYDGGSGSLRLAVAEDAAVRLEVRDSGSGRVRVPSEWDEIEAGDDDEGIWQSATYEDSEDRQMLVIVEDLGSGEIVISN